MPHVVSGWDLSLYIHLHACIGLLSTVCSQLLTGCYSTNAVADFAPVSQLLSHGHQYHQNERIPKTSASDNVDKNSYKGGYHVGNQNMSTFCKITC